MELVQRSKLTMSLPGVCSGFWRFFGTKVDFWRVCSGFWRFFGTKWRIPSFSWWRWSASLSHPGGFVRPAAVHIPCSPRAMQIRVRGCASLFSHRRTLMKASFQRVRRHAKTPHCRVAPIFALHCAVREGFEPPVRCRTPVFEAGSFNHSDISPKGLQI